MNALVKLEPIPLPNARRPTMMPSLPAWLVSRKNAACSNLQVVGSGFQDVMTLPRNLLPTPEQRRAIEDHLRSLTSLLAQIPQKDETAEKAVLVLVTNLMRSKPAQRTTEGGAEATGESYMMALDDVPSWAVEAAIRSWHRGECGADERGQKYDYRWRPDTAALRRLARAEALRLQNRIAELTPILEAVEFVDTSKDLQRGKDAMRGLMKKISDPALKDLTFEHAIEIGSQEERDHGIEKATA